MRSDEEAMLAQVERENNYKKNLRTGIGTVANVGTLVGGTAIASKILPFLSELIPQDLALKGINKLSPSLGNFLKKGQSAGLDLKKGFNFIKSKLENKEQSQSQESQNPLQLISGYSPELADLINSEIGKGITPRALSNKIKYDKKFGSIVAKIEKDLGKTFSEILEEMLGGQSFQYQQPEINQLAEEALNAGDPNADKSLIAALQRNKNAPQTPTNQAQSQTGQGKQDLINAIRQATQMMNNLKGR